MLDTAIKEKWLTANGVIGFFPANAVGSGSEDVEVYTDDTRTEVLTTLHNLRQQGEHRDGIPNRSLGDFIAPRDTGLADYIGAFAVTAGLGSAEKIAEFKAALDDYSAILLESIADRLAEAFAERMHERVRKEFWGYQPDEHLDNDELIGERYVGIRPPRLPGLPGAHREADALDADGRQGAHRYRADRVDGDVARRRGQRLVLSHPQSQYFVVGRLAQDQVADYAKRKGWTLAEAERWLAPTWATTRRTETNGRKAFRADSFPVGTAWHNRAVRAVLWDMDGTLVDSEKLWDVALKELYNRRGRVLAPEVRDATVGGSADGGDPHRLRRSGSGSGSRPHGRSRRLDARLRRRTVRDGVAVASRRPELLDALLAADVPMALVTNTRRALTENALNTIGRQYFSTSVCGDEVQAGKPAPTSISAPPTCSASTPVTVWRSRIRSPAPLPPRAPLPGTGGAQRRRGAHQSPSPTRCVAVRDGHPPPAGHLLRIAARCR